MVIPGSLFEQTLMGPSPKCYIPSFVKIGPQVQEKKSFTICGRDGHRSYNPDAIPPTNRGSTQNLALIRTAIFEKMLEHCGRQ